MRATLALRHRKDYVEAAVAVRRVCRYLVTIVHYVYILNGGESVTGDGQVHAHISFAGGQHQARLYLEAERSDALGPFSLGGDAIRAFGHLGHLELFLPVAFVVSVNPGFPVHFLSCK